MVVGLVLAAHVVALHVHGEHLANLLDPIGVVHAADEPRTIELLVPLRVGENVENCVDGRIDGAFDCDLRVFAHAPTLPKNR